MAAEPRRDLLRLLPAATLLLIGLLAAAIAAGLSDPRPPGRISYSQANITIEASQPGEAVLVPLTPYSLEVPGSIEVEAGLVAGSAAEGGCGLRVCDSAGRCLALAASGTGFIAVLHEAGDYFNPSASMPWQPWPHIRPAGTANRLRIELSAGQADLWANQEAVLSLAWPATGRLSISGLAQALGRPAACRFTQVTVWEEAL